MQNIIDSIDNNVYALGTFALLSFLGGRQVRKDLTHKCNKFMGDPIVRKIIIFSILFTFTKSAKVSFMFTVVYTILIHTVFKDDNKDGIPDILQDL